MAKAILVSGQAADASEFDDSGEEVFSVLEGEHAGHTVTVYTAKHNCGAYEETQVCSCGARYENHMNGCWQQGHQREGQGALLV